MLQPTPTLLWGHLQEEAVHHFQQQLERTIESIGRHLIFQSQPGVLDRIEVRTILGQVVELNTRMLR